MRVGDTFFFEGTEFAIKNIDRSTSLRFPSGRVDASKFVGEGIERRIQRGRPKMFHLTDIQTIFGVVEEPPFETDVAIPEEVKESWSGVRTADPEKVDELLSFLPDDSTTSDW